MAAAVRTQRIRDMARRNRTVRMDDAEWAALRLLPGLHVSDQIRYAVHRATIGVGLREEVRAAVDDSIRTALAEYTREYTREIEAVLVPVLHEIKASILSSGPPPSPREPAPPRQPEGGRLGPALDALRAKGVIK